MTKTATTYLYSPYKGVPPLPRRDGPDLHLYTSLKIDVTGKKVLFFWTKLNWKKIWVFCKRDCDIAQIKNNQYSDSG